MLGLAAAEAVPANLLLAQDSRGTPRRTAHRVLPLDG